MMSDSFLFLRSQAVGVFWIIFYCVIIDFDIDQIDIWFEIVSRVSMLGESRSW